MKKFLHSILESKRSAFTVVELIVVIAVIGILVTVVLLAYPGYQTKIKNDTRKSDLSQISSALKAYAQRNNNYIETGSGCGGSGNGDGWLGGTSEDWSTYSKSIIQCLKEANFLDDTKDYLDPSGCTSNGVNCTGTGRAYMKKNCELSGQKAIYLFAHLEDEPAADDAINGLCDGGLNYGSSYGMNYYVKVN